MEGLVLLLLACRDLGFLGLLQGGGTRLQHGRSVATGATVRALAHRTRFRATSGLPLLVRRERSLTSRGAVGAAGFEAVSRHLAVLYRQGSILVAENATRE